MKKCTVPIRGNIFEALGLPNADELQARVDIAVAITREARGITKAEGTSRAVLAERIGIHPEELADLMRGYVGQFTRERLEHLLTALTGDGGSTDGAVRD